MSQPLYFLPGVTQQAIAASGDLDRKILIERGLDGVFADVRGQLKDCAVCEVPGSGPGGASGVILCYQRPQDDGLPEHVGFYPKQQVWTPRGEAKKLWIGIDPANPPAPEDLLRKMTGRGYPAELADGHEWIVPVIRRSDDSTELPTRMFRTAAGDLEEPVKAAYLTYWEESADVAEWFFSGETFGGPTFSKARAFDLAVRALSIYYRFGHFEQEVFGPLDSVNYLTVLGYTVDVPKFHAALENEEKKSESDSTADSLSITPGPPDDSTDTGPAEETSP